MEYFNNFNNFNNYNNFHNFNNFNIMTNYTIFEYQHYKMLNLNHIYDYINKIEITDYVNEFDLNENFNLSPLMNITILSIIYTLIAYFVSCFLIYDEENDVEPVLEDNIKGVTCLKIPKVFSIVAKEHFKTNTNICLTYAGKLSLGRYLSKHVVRKDISIMYLTDKDPITKKTFRFIRYTKDDYQNMKTATQQWILGKEDKWSSYFAY